MAQQQNELGKSPPPKHSRHDSTLEKQQILKEDKEELYVLQYFHTTSEELTDNVFNLCVSHMVRLFPAIRATFEEIMGENNEEMLRNGLDKFTKAFYSVLERRTDVLNLYLKNNIINIPDNLVLQSDIAQLKYKLLVETLKSKSSSFHLTHEQQFTEENTADILTLEADKLLEKLKKSKLEKLSLEKEIQEQNQLIQRVEKLEQTVSALNESLPNPVCEFVSKSIAAATEVSTLKL